MISLLLAVVNLLLAICIRHACNRNFPLLPVHLALAGIVVVDGVSRFLRLDWTLYDIACLLAIAAMAFYYLDKFLKMPLTVAIHLMLLKLSRYSTAAGGSMVATPAKRYTPRHR